MRFGCCANLEKYGLIQETGYDYIELPVEVVMGEYADEDFEPIIEQIRSYEIIPEVWNGVLLTDMKIVGDEVDLYRVERYIRTSFERIGQLGGEIVVFGRGETRSIPDGFSREEAADQMIDFLTLAGQIAGSHGLTIAVEPLNPKVTNMITSVAQAMDIIHKTNHPFVKLCVDLYQMIESGESLDVLNNCEDDLVHVHIADSGKQYPGAGNYPIAKFISKLREIDYAERISIQANFTNINIEAAKAYEFLKKAAS